MFWQTIFGILNFWVFVMLIRNCPILNKISRNSSFTRPRGLIIDSSRSGTCFSSCLTSSTYSSMTAKYVSDRVNLFLCPWTHRVHSVKPISGPCSIEIMYPLEWRIVIPASFMRVEKRCFAVSLLSSGTSLGVFNRDFVKIHFETAPEEL